MTKQDMALWMLENVSAKPNTYISAVSLVRTRFPTLDFNFSFDVAVRWVHLIVSGNTL